MSIGALKLLTAEQFSRLPDPSDGSKQELVRGEIITMPPPGVEHGEIQGNAYMLVKGHVRARKLGRVAVESGVKTESDPDTVRGPDISYWSYKRLPAGKRVVGYHDLAPDLGIEIRSPDQSWSKLLEKVKEYLTAGVRMVWLIDPDERTVTVYRKRGKPRVLGEDDALTGDDVLPGFSCCVAEFFA